MVDFESSPNGGRVNFGFKFGLIGILVFAIVNIAAVITFSSTKPDFVLWIFQLIAYYIFGAQAAAAQRERQRNTLNQNQGVAAASIGAAMVLSIGMWLVRILRDLVFGIVNPYGILWMIVWALVDVPIAIGIGAAAGRSKTPIENENFY